LDLVLSILAAAVVSQVDPGDREMPEVEVHEWGVIVASGGCFDMLSHPEDFIPPEFPYIPEDPMVDRAPVVYFYGPPFSGRFTVSVPNGEILSTWPSPSTGEATWEITADWEGMDSGPSTDGRVHPDLIDGWDASGWRTPQSLTIRTAEGFVDQFIYYECSVSPAVMPITPKEIGVDVMDGMEDIPVALVIPSYAGTSILQLRAGALENPLELMRNMVTAPSDMLPILYEWSVDIVDIDEVDALWGSWKRWITFDGLPSPESGQALLVYRVPETALDGVSTLELQTAEGYTVDYRRFILCVIPVTLREV
jgi:hypothetical protein